jgi:hypothetical protein
MITIEQLDRELRGLKRGEGIGSPDLMSKVGPGLLRLCNFDGTQSGEILRRRLSSLIEDHAERLIPQQRLAVLAALGLHPEAQHRFLNDRLRWVLPAIDRDVVRTADRLASRGISRIAQSLHAQWTTRRSNKLVPTDWHTSRLEVTVRLDLDQPEFRERRTIVARESGVREILVASMVPKVADPDGADVTVEVVSGGRLISWARSAPTIYTGILSLPAALSTGDRHEYELVYRTRPPELVQPIYLVTPVVQCDHLGVRVRFGRPHEELMVWRLDGVYRGVAEDPLAADAPTVTIDGGGWAEAVFQDLMIGLTYGVRWGKAA